MSLRGLLRSLWLRVFPHPAPASGDTWLPPPAHSAKEGWNATTEDGSPLNDRLCDCTERERQEWKAPHRGPLYGRPACPSYVEGSGTPPRPACTCGKGDSPGWEHRWPTPAHGTVAAQPGCPRWSRSREGATPPKGGSGVRMVEGRCASTACAGGGCWCRPSQYPAGLAEIRAYRRALVDGRCASAACPGEDPGPTPEEAANGACHPAPDHECTARRPPRPVPTPVPGPGRKQSR